MKKVFTLMSVVAVAAFMGNKAKAIDFSSLQGTNYYLIYLDEGTATDYEITGTKIVQDLRPNWDPTNNINGEKALYLWDGSSYVANEATGKGSFDQIGSFLDVSSVGAGTWSGLGFNMRANGGGVTTSFPVDYTAVTDNYHFHMAVKSSTSPLKSHQVQVMGSSTGIAKFSVGVGIFDNAPNITPNFPTNGSWYVIDIPISQLKTYGFTNRDTFIGNYFVTLSGAPTNNLAMDAIFIYLPGATGINDVKADKLSVLVTNQIVEVQNATAPIEVYSITGALVKKSVEPVFGVDQLAKGAYVIKSGNAVAKVIIK